MILTENIVILKKKFPGLWEKLKVLEENISKSTIQPVLSKSGLPTLKIKGAQEEFFLHSKYDPQKEAERFVSQFNEDMEEFQYIFFYGLGLGYHVTEFMKRFPQKTFIAYEPSPEVFFQFITTRCLEELPLKQMETLYIEFDSRDLDAYLVDFVNKIKQKTKLIVLPCYERFFSNQHENFLRQFMEQIRYRRQETITNFAFQKLWIINSMINFPQALRTPNILHDIDKNFFKDKPALLVAAGPSLEFEFENIRLIKEKGLAYVFAVGSAVKALVNKGIYPDATCSFDPLPHTKLTFTEIIEADVKSIPLIFGSSIGFESVTSYPGPKLHMIVDQDTLAPFLLRNEREDKLDIVHDAPTIASVTLELLHKLGCNPIILVGQNLSYRENRYYAPGIDYGDIHQELAMGAAEKGMTTEDVYGGQVLTDPPFMSMKSQLEFYLKHMPMVEVINTTKGGAKIEGTCYIPLEQLVEHRLEKAVVQGEWCSDKAPGYSQDYLLKKMSFLNKEYQEIIHLFEAVINTIQKLDQENQNKNISKINPLLGKFDKTIRKLRNNNFFKLFLIPMNRVRFELLQQYVLDIRKETDVLKRSLKVVQDFGSFIYDCKQDFQSIAPLFEMIMQETNSTTGQNLSKDVR